MAPLAADQVRQARVSTLWPAARSAAKRHRGQQATSSELL